MCQKLGGILEHCFPNWSVPPNLLGIPLKALSQWPGVGREPVFLTVCYAMLWFVVHTLSRENSEVPNPLSHSGPELTEEAYWNMSPEVPKAADGFISGGDSHVRNMCD